MTLKTLTKTLAVMAGTGLSLTAVGIHSASAAIVTYQYTVDLESSFFLTGSPALNIPPFPDYYDGYFRFDDASLTGVGLESLGVNDGLSITLINDPRITADDDDRYPTFPTVNFQDGELLGLDYFVVYHPFSAIPAQNYPGDFFRFSNADFSDGFDPTFYTPEDEPRLPVLGNGTVTFIVVPEPSLTLGLVVTLGVAVLSQKKVSKRRENEKN